jgi:hypothetical protein
VEPRSAESPAHGLPELGLVLAYVDVGQDVDRGGEDVVPAEGRGGVE